MSEYLIDYERLYRAYDNDEIYSIQLEVENICDDGCENCFMNRPGNLSDRLSDELIKDVLYSSKKLNVTAIDWVGGDPLLRSSIFELLSLSKNLDLRNNVWTTGLNFRNDSFIKELIKYTEKGLISVHLSTTNPIIYEELHNNRTAKDIDTILEGVCKLLKYGYHPEKIINTISFTKLQPIDDLVDTIDLFYSEFGIKSNLYIFNQDMERKRFLKELDEFDPYQSNIRYVYDKLKEIWGVKELSLSCINKQYCSTVVAVLFDGRVTPCTMIRELSAPNIRDYDTFYQVVVKHRNHLIYKNLKSIEKLPISCQTCIISNKCWGCRAKSFSTGKGLFDADPGCYKITELEIEQ